MEPLEIIVTGKVDGAKSSLQSIQAELGKTALSAQKSDSAIDTFGKTMARFGTQGGASIALLTGKIEALKAEMVNIKDISVLAKFNQEIEASESQLAKMANVGKEGFDKLGNAIGSTGNPLSKAYGGLRKLAYVLPGIGISGLVAFATEPIIAFVQKLMEASSSAQTLKQVMDDAQAIFSKSVSKLEVLKAKLDDLSIPEKERLAIAKEYNKIADAGNQIDLTQINNIDLLNARIAKQTELLKERALAQAGENILAKKGEALFKAKVDFDIDFPQASDANVKGLTNVAEKAVQEAQKRLNVKSKLNINELLAVSDLPEDQINKLASTNDRFKVLLDKNTLNIVSATQRQLKAIENYKSGLKGNSGGIAVAQENINNLQKDFDDALKIVSGLTTTDALITKDKKIASGKKINPFEIALKDLEDNYKKAQALLVSQYDANLTDAKKNTTAVNDLVLKAQQDFLEKKLALIKRYGKKEGDTDLEIAKANKAIIANQIGFNIEQINTLQKVQGAPNINFKKVTTEYKIDPKPYYELSDAIKANIKLQERQLELFNETSLVLNKTLGPAFDALFTNILDGSGNALQAFGEAIKQMMVQLAAAVLKAAAFAAILSLLPGSAEFGTIFKKTLGFSKGGEVKGFATGGFINGPGTASSDSILARLSRGEYIINAATVSKFGTSFFDNLNSGMLPNFNRGGSFGSNQLITSTTAIDHYFHGEIAGDKLLLLHDRATARRRRNS
jgi:hypothetical protein